MGFAFTDAHVHCWDPSLLAYPWLAGAPAIAGAHRPGDLDREAGEGAPSRMVFVQADCAPGAAPAEVAWVEALAAADRRIAAIVAFAPMDAGARTRAALQSLAARPLVRGVRHLIQDEPDPAFCLRDAFVAGVRACGDFGLSFDLCVRPPQLPAVAELVGRCPGTRFILDHGGKPALGGPDLERWRAGIAAIAQHPHVACKLSGLVTEALPAEPTEERVAPAVRHLLAAFGPGRLLFGGDWPVVKLACPYARWLKMTKKLLAHLADAEQAAIFNDNAAQVYRLG
jgi:L-fuconolactonase